MIQCAGALSPTSRVNGERAGGPAAPRVLLLDVLDSVGADLADVRDRAALLREAGAQVRAVAVGPGLEVERTTAGRALGTLTAGPTAIAEVRSLAHSGRYDLILVASAAPHGGELAGAMPATLRGLWWPTGVGGGQRPRGWLGRLARHARRPRALPSLLDVAGDAAELDGAGFAASAIASRPASRSTLPLWDGEVVLAPEGLDGRGGAVALAAFASVAEEWNALDLVTWSHPLAKVTARARRLGVEGRIHQVGPPPRMAEWGWWTQALAVLLTGEARLSGGLLLRALAAGCPLLCVPGDPRLARALADRGCALVAEPQPRRVARALSRLLERGPEVEAIVERGRAFAASHDRPALAARLARLLGRGHAEHRPARPAAAA